VNVKKKIFSIWSVLLVLVVSIAIVVPGCTPTTGTIEVKATLDGVDWPSSGTGAVTYTLTGPGATAPTIINGTKVPDSHSGDAGNWTCAYVSGGPPGAHFIDITDSPTQELSAGGTITFTLNFVTPVEVDAFVVFDTWTIDGAPVPPGWYPINPGTVVDARYTEGVSGNVSGNQTGKSVRVKETLWTKYHNWGYEGEQGPPRTLHVVNAWGAVWANPPFEQKISQQATVGGVPVQPCQNIPCPFCETINLDVEIETVQKVGTNYTKSVNWIRFNPSAGGMSVLLDGDGEIFEDVAPYIGWETFTLSTWACIEVGPGFVDTNPDNDCCPESPQITIAYNPPPP
jgi:hypothetical protein